MTKTRSTFRTARRNRNKISRTPTGMVCNSHDQGGNPYAPEQIRAALASTAERHLAKNAPQPHADPSVSERARLAALKRQRKASKRRLNCLEPLVMLTPTFKGVALV